MDGPRFDNLVWDDVEGLVPGDPIPRDIPMNVEIDDIGGDDDMLASEFEIGPDGEASEMLDGAQDIDVLPPEGDHDHLRNLAPDLDDDILNKMGADICEAVERDIEDRQPWADRFRRGMEMMGLVDADIDDGPFPGASTVTHPLITEACTQFWARAMGELVPSEGPAKSKVMGAQTEEKNKRGQRVENYVNYELLFTDDQWYSEHSRYLFAIPLQGSAFKKVYRDAGMLRNVSIFVAAEDLIAPSNISSLQSSPRYTHRIWRTPNELRRAVVSGFYIDADLHEPESEDLTDSALARLETSDQNASDESQDARYELYEHYCEWDIEGHEDTDERGKKTGIALPYIITVDRSSQKVLSIYRNWKQPDPGKRSLCCFIKGDYVPGPASFYGLGLFHLIGGLQQAATGALRAILDSAATSSLQGGFVSKDANLRDERMTIEPGIWKGVDATAEELSKAFFTPPFKEPSNTLFNALQFLTQRGEKFAATTELMTGEQGSANAPVGSTLAIIEQAQKVFSTIHRGLHMALAQELRLRYDLIQQHMPDGGYPYDEEGNHEGLMEQDFAPGVTIVPVSDPNIFSSAQRVAIAQAEMQLADSHPNLMKPQVALRRFLEAMRAPNIDELLIDDNPPPPMDPVSEVQSILRGEPVQAYPDQNHEAHIQHYMSFLENPGFGGNQMLMQQIEGPAMALVGQRLAYLWAANARNAGVQAPMLLPAMTPEDQIPQDEQGQKVKFDPRIPAAPPEVINQMLQQAGPQLAQAPGIPVPPDPNQEKENLEAQRLQAEMQMKQAESQMKQAEHQAKSQALQEELATKRESHQLAMAEVTAKLQQSQQLHDIEVQKRTVDTGVDAQKSMADSEIKARESDVKMRELDIKAAESAERIKKIQIDTEVQEENLNAEREKLRLEREKWEHEATIERERLEMERDVERQKAAAELEKIRVELAKVQQSAATVATAASAAEGKSAKKGARASAVPAMDNSNVALLESKLFVLERRLQEQMDQMKTADDPNQTLAQLMDVMSRPRRILRDEDGNIIGSELG